MEKQLTSGRRMPMNRKSFLPIRIAFFCLFLAGWFLALTIKPVSAQTSYLVGLNPTESTIYLNVGQIANISFQAVWAYGDNIGQAIEYANVEVEVRTAEGAVTDTVLANTSTTGFAYFNYSLATPQILTFTPSKLIMQDGTELNSGLLPNGETALHGLQSESATVYWDTFDVELVSTNTETSEALQVSVNVTYLLVPEEGLVVQSLNNSHQQFFPKIAYDVNVTVNGVAAEETAVPGIYSANVSTLMPTAYVIVKVSQDGWATASKAFGFAHESNMTVWQLLAVICASAFAAAFFAVLIVWSKKFRPIVSKRWILPALGGFLLILSSFIELYWVLVWFESALHGFDWLLYGILGVFSVGFGILGGVTSLRRKKQTMALWTVSLSLFANVIAVYVSLGTYQLAIPWSIILPTFACSLISGILIGNSDDQFQTAPTFQKQTNH